MRPIRWQLLALVMALMLVPAIATAQEASRECHIGYVYPAGGQQGSSFDIAVGGQFLDGVSEARISQGGVSATIIEHIKPLRPGQAAMLRDKLKLLQDKRRESMGLPPASRPSNKAGDAATTKRAAAPATMPSTRPIWTDGDEKQVEEIRKQLAEFVKKPANAAIVETVRIHVTISPDAAVGHRELRLRTPQGLTNPLVFCVGQLPEYSEKQASNGPTSEVRHETSITIPATVNGQSMPGGIALYHFDARQGQHLVVSTAARELMPYIADAVPGWFQATLGLYDAEGHELAYDDQSRSNPDPLLMCVIPKDGRYTVQIKDALFRGREDFVYRVSIGELPLLTGIYPLGGSAGAKTPVTLTGWNLPSQSLVEDETGKTPGIYPLLVRNGNLLSNPLEFAVDSFPSSMEKDAHDSAETAQMVSLPIAVNGRIERPGQWDVYRFGGRAGQQIVAEVYARRLGSPLDSVLKLTNATGKQLAFNDDFVDRSFGLITHQADSLLQATLPSDGAYYLYVGDVQNRGGAEYAYRLRIGVPRPDFELRITPSAINIRAGEVTAVTVHAIRRDGFAGEIALTLVDPPTGLTLGGGVVPDNQDKVRVTLTAPPNATREPTTFRLDGRATIEGRVVEHTALPADEMMQAFAYKHLVGAEELSLNIYGRSMGRRTLQVLGALPVKIFPGQAARLSVGWPANPFQGKLEFELNDPPEGLSLQSGEMIGGRTEMVFQADPAKIKANLKGNLIIDVFQVRDGKDASGKARQARVPLGTCPAIPFQVIGGVEH